jgi:hypothetical protein
MARCRRQRGGGAPGVASPARPCGRRAGSSGTSCVTFVVILGFAGAYCAILTPRFLLFQQVSGLEVWVALSELRLNSSLVRYLRQYEGVSTSADTVPASEATSQQYQPWSIERRLSETDIQTIIAEFLSGTPKHELARRYSVGLTALKSLLRRRGIRRDGRGDTSH